jgi:hypothetical protein
VRVQRLRNGKRRCKRREHARDLNARKSFRIFLGPACSFATPFHRSFRQLTWDIERLVATPFSVTVPTVSWLRAPLPSRSKASERLLDGAAEDRRQCLVGV